MGRVLPNVCATMPVADPARCEDEVAQKPRVAPKACLPHQLEA
jgi:hypothetical protein